MSDGAEYPKWVTCKDGLKVEVQSAADEALWLNAPAPPDPVKAPEPPTILNPTGPFGASAMVDGPKASSKKGKGAIHA